MSNPSAEQILADAARLRHTVGGSLHDSVTEAIYTDAAQIADRAVTRDGQRAAFSLDRAIDRVVTSPIWGFPIMVLMLMGVFWLTIAGANVPSAILGELLTGQLYAALHAGAAAVGAPAWLSGLLIDGVYLATAWVISVMLPPMAIFFPLFTLLEDLGYLPRVAFNLDRLFKGAGAHGKQSLSMMMGWGCNAAGVVATRIIDSPRERLIAIITNNFSICNGRWPTLILMGTVFIGATVAPGLASLVAAASVVTVTIIGIFTTLIVSAVLSRTMLKGEASTFSLELPPYRPPRVLQTIYTSLIDRTMIVLWRAVVMAAPAGAVIWLLSNITVGDASLAGHLVNFLEPLGWLLGLNGVILLAYIVAIPANEIIIPTILMLTLTLGRSQLAQAGVMLELEPGMIGTVLTELGGWTALTAVNLMLFSLLHNPCSTTILTIWKETKSLKWTALATLLPVALGVAVTFTTATIARLAGWV
ncbi:ferrous iron transporter B [Oscillochloris sp. ZM17-4]|uniref:nucleoside recognition domain-containing protein n=1 Tax=Oscillochloris sp. ZM17-4 TaxID=2866714 RepID=UPI001C72F34E|nr:nucleoside recognition domain-containing protein [Oscillochloris sp. ZM17-4]MBX0329626.1 ferrous iron transporter B [Oscillochloris sp. ZM17-4]